MEPVQIGVWEVKEDVQVTTFQEYAAYIDVTEIKKGEYPILVKFGRHGRPYILIEAEGTIHKHSYPKKEGTRFSPYLSPYFYQLEEGKDFHGGTLQLFDSNEKIEEAVMRYKKFGGV